MNKKIIFLVSFLIGTYGILFASGSKEYISVQYEDKDDEFGTYCNSPIKFIIKHNLDTSSIIKIKIEIIWRKNFEQEDEELIKIDRKVYYFYSNDITINYLIGSWDDEIMDKIFENSSDETFIILIYLNGKLIHENKNFWVGCSTLKF